MISLLAPSKTFDFESDAPEWVVSTNPMFYDEAAIIVGVLSEISEASLARRMRVSAPIAKLNKERLTTWGDIKKPALWAYKGDVYKGMYADTLTSVEAEWAQKHIRIMSGMYGILRPTDAISPYRLEMKTKLSIRGAKDLYEFWGSGLAKSLESDAIICNLASEEYAKPITKHAHQRIVTPVFMDNKPNGAVGAVPIYSKMMRGVMARWIIDNRIDNPDELVRFDRFDYFYDASRSARDAPVFVRRAMTPLVFVN